MQNTDHAATTHRGHEFELDRCIHCGISTTSQWAYRLPCPRMSDKTASTALAGRESLVAPAMKQCPWCAEDIRLEAKLCRFCGHELDDGGGQHRMVDRVSRSVPSTLDRVSGPFCPKCASQHVTANKKGFGLGKALIGGVVTGGVGLLAGFMGSNAVMVTCLQCGHSWKAGKLG